MPYTVGSVPFLNARPLVAWFESLGENSPVKVRYDLPARLPTLLDAGEADAILVSSVEALTVRGRAAATGVCIGSRGRAESVRLFSKRPFEGIRSLALDAGSMTSNVLVQILLAESFSCRPWVELCEPDLEAMIDGHDAALLIGDKGMSAAAAGLRVLDLGEAWTELTGLPFVWALWVGRRSQEGDGAKGLAPELCSRLNEALDWAEENPNIVIPEAAARGGFDQGAARRYLTETMNFRLQREDLAGLRAFGKLLEKHRLFDEVLEPSWVAPGVPAKEGKV